MRCEPHDLRTKEHGAARGFSIVKEHHGTKALPRVFGSVDDALGKS